MAKLPATLTSSVGHGNAARGRAAATAHRHGAPATAPSATRSAARSEKPDASTRRPARVRRETVPVRIRPRYAPRSTR